MEKRLYKELKRIKRQIPWKTYRTIIGQIKAGDLSGAQVGIERLKRRIEKEGCSYAHSNR